MSEANSTEGVIVENTSTSAVVDAKPTVRKPKKSKKAKKVVAKGKGKGKKTSKPVKASKKTGQRGRPALYTPAQAKIIVGMVKQYGVSPTVRMLRNGEGPKGLPECVATISGITVTKMAKNAGVELGGPGRPSVYSDTQGKVIAKLAKKHGASGALRILRAGKGAEFPKNAGFPDAVTSISLPTIFKFAKANGVEFSLGRPKVA